MDSNIKLIERYKNIRLIYEIKLRDGEQKIGLFNLKTLKLKSENTVKVLVLQSSIPEHIPNYNLSIQMFNSTITKQKIKNKYIGFYNLIVAKEINAGDILHISLNNNTRYEEIPFRVSNTDDEEIRLYSVTNCTDYDEIAINKKDFDFMLKKGEFLKYEFLPDDWFDENLEEWLEEIEG